MTRDSLLERAARLLPCPFEHDPEDGPVPSPVAMDHGGLAYAACVVCPSCRASGPVISYSGGQEDEAEIKTGALVAAGKEWNKMAVPALAERLARAEALLREAGATVDRDGCGKCQNECASCGRFVAECDAMPDHSTEYRDDFCGGRIARRWTAPPVDDAGKMEGT